MFAKAVQPENTEEKEMVERMEPVTLGNEERRTEPCREKATWIASMEREIWRKLRGGWSV